MSVFLGLLVGLASLPAIGEILLRAGRFDQAGLSRTERLVVTFGLGNGAVVLEMFFFTLGNLPLALWALAIPWSLVGGSLLYSCWSRRQPLSFKHLTDSPTAVDPLSPPSQQYTWNWWELLLAIAIALAVLDLFVTTLTTPFLYGDATWFWTPKAKIFYHHRFAPFAALHDLSQFAHPDYPLLLPLTEVWLFLWMGQVNEYLMKLLFPIYTVFLVLGMWAFVCRFACQRAALIAAGLLATTPTVLQWGTAGYADVLLTFYYWLATALLFGWFQTSRPALLLLGGIFLGLTGWTKNEGLPLLLLNSCALAGYLLCQRKASSMRRLCPALLFGGVTVCLVLPWLCVRYSLGLESDLSVPPVSSLLPLALQRGWPIAKAFTRELFALSNVLTKWNLAWYLLVLVLALHNRSLWQSLLRFSVLLIAGQVLVYLFVYIITPYDVSYHLSTSLDRLLLHVYPLVLLLIGWGIATEMARPS